MSAIMYYDASYVHVTSFFGLFILIGFLLICHAVYKQSLDMFTLVNLHEKLFYIIRIFVLMCIYTDLSGVFFSVR